MVGKKILLKLYDEIMRYKPTFISMIILVIIIFIYIYLSTKTCITDENTIRNIYSTLAAIFGQSLALIGIFVVFRYEIYDKKITDLSGFIHNYANKIDIANRRGDTEKVREYNIHYEDLLNERTFYFNEQTELIKRFGLTGSLTIIVFIFSLYMLSIYKILIDIFGYEIVFLGVAFSIFVLYIIFLFIISSFQQLNITRIDGRPLARWYQIWKWIDWRRLREQ